MSLKEIYNKISGKNEVYEELKLKDRALAKLERSKLSHDEVMLSKIIEEKRKKIIKSQVGAYLKQKDKEYWHDKTVMAQPNIFTHQKNIFVNGVGRFG